MTTRSVHDDTRRTSNTRAFAVALVALAFATCAASPARAADALRGKALYANTNGAAISCANSACHGPNPATNKNKILRGANNGPLISAAITANTGGMGFLGPFVNATDAADIGAYIANPTVTAAPVASVSPGALSFASTSVGTTSASSFVTVSNTGAAPLSLAGATLGGAVPGDWTLPGGGTCAIPGTVAAGSGCTIAVAFRPTAAGTRGASLAIAHDAAGSPSTVSLTGTGTTTPQPSISLSVASIDFGGVVIGTPSTTRTIVVSNPGNATLSLGAVTTSGPQSGEFARSGGTCATTVAAGASCTLGVVFTPAALGARAASLDIASNAPSGTASLPLAGNGQPVPVPGATLSPSTVTFGNAAVGIDAPTRAVVLTSDGTAPLAVGVPLVTPTNAGFRIASSDCPATLAVGASCTLQVAFRPAAAGAASATLSVPSNAPGSPDVASLSGTGVNGPAAAPAISPSGRLTFGATDVGSTSAAQTLTLDNRGTASTRVTAIALSGANAGDFRLAGTCSAGIDLAPAASCTIVVSFAPSAAGTRVATLSASTDSGAQFQLPLDGTGTAVVAPPAASGGVAEAASAGTDVPATAPVNIGAGGCTMLAVDTPDPLLPALVLGAGLLLALRRARRARDASVASRP